MMTNHLAKSIPVYDVVNENILYVVMHGFITLVDMGASAGFDAYLLDMADAHSYLYGDWLYENPFGARAPGQGPIEATLHNVDSADRIDGINTLDPIQNVIVKLDVAPNLMHPSVLAILHLPRPRAIYYSLPGKLQDKALQGTAGDIGKILPAPKFISAARIFEYTFSRLDQVELFVVPESPVRLWGPSQLTVNLPDKTVSILHIYDEPLNEQDDATAIKHSLEEFNKSMEFLGVSISLTKPCAPPPLPNSAPDGLLPEELDSLDQRPTLLMQLLNRSRGGKDNGGGGTGGQVCSGAHGVLPSSSIPRELKY